MINRSEVTITTAAFLYQRIQFCGQILQIPAKPKKGANVPFQRAFARPGKGASPSAP